VNRWHWFMAVDFEGRWTTLDGFVDLSVIDDVYEGSLMTSEDVDPLDHVSISSASGEELVAVMTPPDSQTAPYKLHGTPFIGENKSGDECRSMILTDGSTVLGLTLGPRSQT